MADDQESQDDLMGYGSVGALKEAKLASDREAKRLAEELRQERAMQHSYAENQRQSVPQRNATPFDRLVEYGVPADAIREAIDERAGQLIQQAFSPIAKGFQARNEMLAEHPDYAEFESKVAAHVQSDEKRKARYERMFVADPVGANEWAYLDYGNVQRKNGKTETSRRREESAHAAIPTERSGESRRRPDDDSQISEAAKEVRDSGRSREAVEKYAKLRLKQAIPDGFLNQ